VGKHHKESKRREGEFKKPGWIVNSPWASLLILTIAGLLAYANSFSASFHFDDEGSIVNNPLIHSLGNIAGIWHRYPTRFLTYLSFALNYRIGGLNVVGYHIVNLTLHVLCGFLVWLLVRQIVRILLSSGRLKTNLQLAPIFAALFFVLHPVQTQAVTYIVQRATVLAALFYLTSVYFFVEGRKNQLATGSIKGNLKFFSLSALAGLCGLLSKETILTLPFALLLMDSFFLSPGKGFNWKFGIGLLAFFLLFSLAMIQLNLVSMEDAPAISQVKYISTQPQVVLTYLRLAVLPYSQNLDYDFRIAQSPLELVTLLSLAALALLVFLAFKLFKRNRLLSFCIGWFLLVLLPESSILPLADVIFEHRMYLPLFAFSLAIVALWERFNLRVSQRMMSVFAFTVCVAAGYLTYERNRVWSDEVTLWSDVVSKSPGKARGYSNRGRALAETKRPQEALADFNRALSLDPTNSDCYNNRANVLVQNGYPDEAIADCDSALKHPPPLDYQYGMIFFNRGTAYLRKNQIEPAIRDLNEALRLIPAHESALFNRAIAFAAKGEYDKAIADNSSVLEMNPGHVKALNNRGIAYRELGKLDEALADFNSAIALQPSYGQAYVNRGILWNLKGDLQRAESDFNSCLSYLPRNAEALYWRGVVHSRRGDQQNALADFDRALSINPGLANAFTERQRVLKLLKTR
jgi:protein O-mannosyl-transferase